MTQQKRSLKIFQQTPKRHINNNTRFVQKIDGAASSPSLRETANYYCTEDLPSASIPGTRLQSILANINLGKQITSLSRTYLQAQGMDALYRLVMKQLDYDSFRKMALAEQAIRIETAAATAFALATEVRNHEIAIQLAVEKAEATQRARENSPDYQANLRIQALRSRYGFHFFIEQNHLDRVMRIAETLDQGNRLEADDFVWISSVAIKCFTRELRIAYHKSEAIFFAVEYGKVRDPWMAVNASGHYRKCNCASDADRLISTISVEHQKSSKLKSALCTTRGGALRDMFKWDEARHLGEKAHAFMPNDYRPCTLLGAIHMETGNYELGQEWYAKAVERGASVDAVDQDLRTAYSRVDHARKKEMREFLLRQDPVRYAWAQDNLGSKKFHPARQNR